MLDGFPIVVLACSTGGLDAVSRVLGPLPAGYGGAVVVMQHLSPHAPGSLPGILASRTALPVVSATDGVHLRVGHVLVAPPGHHLLATTSGALAMIPAGDVPPYRPSADLLLATLAVIAGPRVIAVVLSGQGNDAATGATAVHHFGGLVVVADPTTSTARAMPDAAIAQSDFAYHVIPVDDIAEFLVTRGAVTAPGVNT